ncbi:MULTISPECIES: hypothetical protein [Methylobacterium]|uniref:Uncharacterized protein n=1 Tax=Methylobacterium bullatum TaxID=570505 RepID=A0A679KDW5_9HYPH|nr:hypothetical protein [Methylobacterium sp. Leaf106]KQP40783.1 hypothetical protein ASF34_21855 [Methylobacterium sp. Leaf106]CAA2145553.1 hypothetical protein MBLL_04679 [Methylobacterium bullatum]
MSTVRAEGYIEALAGMRATIQHRIYEPDITNDGKLELLHLLSMLDDMLKRGQPHEEPDNAAPEPLSGSF